MRPCAVCIRKDRKNIDAALISGTPCARISGAQHVSVDALKRHRSNGHVDGIPKATKKPPKVPGLTPADVARLRTPEPESVPAIVEALPEKAAVSLRSPSDVLGALEATFAEALALLDRSKQSGDLRTQNSLLNTMVVTLDKLAKSVGLYSDAPIVNVDASTKKIEVAFQGMTDDEVREFIRANGQPALEAAR